MKAYQIVASGFGVGAGALLLISPSQADDRAHRIEIVAPASKDSPFALVRAGEAQQFKIGELLGLETLPKGQQHMAELIKPEGAAGEAAALVRACGDAPAVAPVPPPAPAHKKK